MKPLETFYDECISTKILQCERKASRKNGHSPCARRLSEMMRIQAAFFEDEKDRLVQEMVQANLGKDLAKISAFLIRSFTASFPARACTDPSSGNGNGTGPSGADCFRLDDAGIRKMHEPTLLNCNYSLDAGRMEKLFELPWSDGSLIDDAEN